MANQIYNKNLETGKTEKIIQQELKKQDWGFSFFVNNELEAYKSAYKYKNSPHGVKIEFIESSKRWQVTVFNSFAVEMKLDGAK